MKISPLAFFAPLLIACPGMVIFDVLDEGVFTNTVFAQEKNPRSDNSPKEREQRALTFVRQNHTELVQLLTVLKKADRSEYAKAINEIARVADRLERSRTRQPERYEIEVALWKAGSHLNLLVASLPMAESKSEALQEIESALQDKYRLQEELASFELKQARQRLERIKANREKLTDNREQYLEKQMERFERSVEEVPTPKAKAKSKSQ